MEFTPGDFKSAYTYFHRQALDLVGDEKAQQELLVRAEIGLAHLTQDIASTESSDIEREAELVLYFQLKQLLEILRALSEKIRNACGAGTIVIDGRSVLYVSC